MYGKVTKYFQDRGLALFMVKKIGKGAKINDKGIKY